MSDEHEEHEHIHGFAVPVPAGLMEHLTRDQQRAGMRADQKTAAVFRFLDSLDVDSLMALRTMLNHAPDHASLMNQYYDGQVVTLLRLVHHVDPETGEDPLQVAKEASA